MDEWSGVSIGICFRCFSIVVHMNPLLTACVQLSNVICTVVLLYIHCIQSGAHKHAFKLNAIHAFFEQIKWIIEISVVADKTFQFVSSSFFSPQNGDSMLLLLFQIVTVCIVTARFFFSFSPLLLSLCRFVCLLARLHYITLLELTSLLL